MHPPPYVSNQELSRRNTEQRLFADWPGPVAGYGRIAAADETQLFKQLHYCAYRLSRLYQAADRCLRDSREEG